MLNLLEDLLGLQSHLFGQKILDTRTKTRYPIVNCVSYMHLPSRTQAMIASVSALTEPKTYTEAKKDEKWIEAMQLEIKALEDNGT